MSNKSRRKLVFFCLVLFEAAPLLLSSKVALISDVEVHQEMIEDSLYIRTC